MFAISHFPRQIRMLLVLGICLLITSMLPVAPAAAAKVTKRLDDKLLEFTRGTLQRTSLSAYPKTSIPSDAKGAVQLMPVSVIKNWQRLGATLPKRLTDHGVVSIGNTIFVLGGLASDPQTDPAPTNEVWSVQIDPATGAPMTTSWFNETPDLPNVKHNDILLYSQLETRRTQMAVTAVATGDNSGFIYVMGGRVKPTGAPQEISSYSVDIATVLNGHITTWNTTNQVNLRIPIDGHDPTWGLNGLQLASAVSHKIGNTTYVYLIGGLERFANGLSIQEVGSSQVYYAKVRTSDGMLIKPSTTGTVGWETLAPIPIPTNATNSELVDDLTGLWDATALVGTFEFGDEPGGTPNKRDVLYITGGQYQSELGNDVSNLYSNAVYRAFVNPNGSLTWTSASPTEQWEGTLPHARISMGGVEVNGKLYLTGGRQIQSGVPQNPEAAVLTSIVEDNFTLLDQGGSAGSNFIYQENTLREPISPRARHGSVRIQLKVTDQDADAPAYVYVVGGVGAEPDTESVKGSDTLIYAKVGGDEDTAAVGFASNGWYYSTIHETNRNFTGEQVQQIDWTTVMTDAAMDIEMQYRTSTDNECTNPAALNAAAWQNMDGVDGNPKRSKTGANAHVLGVPPPTHCFQYRAKLVNGTGGIQVSTPLLLNVSIQVIIPGSPDLQVQTLTAQHNGNGEFTGLNVQILNHYTDTTGNYPTQPADVEQLGGSFFVDLLVFGPGETEVPPPPPWTTNPPGDKACASISKSQMPVDAQVLIQRWYSLTAGSSCNQTQIEMKDLFSVPGNYVVYVMVDSYECAGNAAIGCVDESSPNAETNNFKRLAFTVDKVGIPDTLLPIIMK